MEMQCIFALRWLRILLLVSMVDKVVKKTVLSINGTLDHLVLLGQYLQLRRLFSI